MLKCRGHREGGAGPRQRSPAAPRVPWATRRTGGARADARGHPGVPLPRAPAGTNMVNLCPDVYADCLHLAGGIRDCVVHCVVLSGEGSWARICGRSCADGHARGRSGAPAGTNTVNLCPDVYADCLHLVGVIRDCAVHCGYLSGEGFWALAVPAACCGARGCGRSGARLVPIWSSTVPMCMQIVCVVLAISRYISSMMVHCLVNALGSSTHPHHVVEAAALGVAPPAQRLAPITGPLPECAPKTPPSTQSQSALPAKAVAAGPSPPPAKAPAAKAPALATPVCTPAQITLAPTQCKVTQAGPPHAVPRVPPKRGKAVLVPAPKQPAPPSPPKNPPKPFNIFPTKRAAVPQKSMPKPTKCPRSERVAVVSSSSSTSTSSSSSSVAVAQPPDVQRPCPVPQSTLASWDSVVSKMNTIWEMAGAGAVPTPLKIFALAEVGTIAVIAMDTIIPAAPAAPGSGAWPWRFDGIHGTTPYGLRGIIYKKAILPQHAGSRGIYMFGGCQIGPMEVKAALKDVLLSPEKGMYGLALHLRHLGLQHKVVKSGGVAAEREAEMGPDKRPLYVTHCRQGSESRWCLPEGYVSVVRLFVHIEKLASTDVDAVLNAADVFQY